MTTRAERQAHLIHVFDTLRLPGEAVPVFLDSLLDAMPDMMEDRERLAAPVHVIRSYGHLDEYPEATREAEDDIYSEARKRINKKRFEFAKVEMAFEQLRDAIRTYYREVRI